MPRLLTRGNDSPKSATRWPASSRNAGRDHIGTMADITSEQVAGLRRNLHLVHGLGGSATGCGRMSATDNDLITPPLSGVRAPESYRTSAVGHAWP
jgi:hypothetical protein